MKKYLLLLSAFAFITLTFSGCKKSSDDNTPVSTGFIKFDLDGQGYEYYAYNNPAAYGSVSFSNTTTQHALQILFYASANNLDFQSVTLQQTSPDSLQVKNYVYSAYSNTQFPQFTQQLVNLYRYTLSNMSTGNIEITRLDTVAGGLVQGNFNFTNLQALNQYNIIESYPHSITNGSFSVTIGSK